MPRKRPRIFLRKRVHRISGSQIIAYKNGTDIDYKEIVLPQKVLAISFMVNDKFQFSKDEDDGIYTYHGVRSSTNSTYTSSITRNIIFDLIHCIEQGLTSQVMEIFSILQFDSTLEFQWKIDNKIDKERYMYHHPTGTRCKKIHIDTLAFFFYYCLVRFPESKKCQ